MDPQHSAQDVLRCDHCDALTPKLYCDICLHNLCKNCAGEHILDESKKHNVVPFKNRRSTIFYPYCPKHTTKQCELYCELCDTPICSSCVSSSIHNGHNFSDIFESLERKKEDLEKDLHELEAYICPKYQQMASHISGRKADLHQNSEKVTTAIIEQGEAWHKAIDTLTNNLKFNADKMETEQLCLLNKQEDEISRTISEITQSIVDLKKLLGSNDISLVTEYKSRIAEFRKLPPQCRVSLQSFSPLTIDTEQLQNQFGSLSSFPITAEEHVYVNEYTNAGDFPSDSQLLDVPLLRKTINTAIGHSFLSSVDCLNDDEIWTCGIDSIMKLHNLQGQLVRSIETKSGNVPFDIAVTRDGDLVYSDPNDRTVNIVKNTKTQEVIRLAGWKPRSVCVTFSGDLLVIMLSDDIRRTKIVHYSGSTYYKKQTIQFNDKSQPLYSSGYTKKYITENRNLDICVSDYMAGAVVVVDKTGNFRFSYTGPPTKRQFDPIGVATDSQSRILTVDGNDYRIHIIDQDGKFLRFIDNCDLQNPCDLCVDTQDNLFVAENRTGEVKKIQYCGSAIIR